jgi:hypothetical protein
MPNGGRGNWFCRPAIQVDCIAFAGSTASALTTGLMKQLGGDVYSNGVSQPNAVSPRSV